ncbi:MAG: immune inhibitor A domain-containing protein [Mycobacterium sp.]
MKQAAQEAVLNGKATPKGKNQVVKLAKGQYVELAFEGEDKIFTLLGEFGNVPNNTHAGHPAHNGLPGPQHNQIPQPNRATDNTTIWTQDFSQSYYQNLLFNKSQVPSMANWYLQSSSGKYSVNGYVGPWVQVPYNEAAYGSNYCGSIVCTRDVGRFMVDQTTAWYSQMLLTMTAAQIDAMLAPFDVWDRYDYDGDGNFNEPDGYIDHFQSVHAGDGEETGGGAQGTDAIWSHRSYANPPAGQGSSPHGFGGIHIGNSSYWIGDYTIEPENGGVGVFTHEFGHDLGLPDEYDTSGNTGGAENSTAWWTNWSQGSYGTIDQNGLGMYPVAMTAWERWELGFINNYNVAFAGDQATFHMGPVEYNTKKPQVTFIVLPDKQVSVTLGAPAAGPDFFYSGSGNSLDTNMTRSVTLPAGVVSLSAQVRFNIEADWDYAYLTVNGTNVPTSLSVNTSPNGQNLGEGITGVHTAWGALTADLSAYAGQTVTLGFRYWTDVAQQGDPSSSYIPGFQVDAINITGQPADLGGFTFATNSAPTGFHVTTGQETQTYFNAYVLENRTFLGYDQALQKGPYNFTSATFVEHFANEPGLLIWYWDTAFSDNNVGDHPGEGQILPVDAHPAIETWTSGTQMRPRIQTYDSTFTKTATHAITLHNLAEGLAAKTISSKPGNSVFNDSLRDGDGTSIYWAPGDPSDAAANGRYQAEWNSVNVPNTGTVVRLKSISSTGEMVIDINK